MYGRLLKKNQRSTISCYCTFKGEKRSEGAQSWEKVEKGRGEVTERTELRQRQELAWRKSI
jgi:hypothetical protein